LVIEAGRSDHDAYANIYGNYEITTLSVDEQEADEIVDEEYEPGLFQPLMGAINENENGVQAELLTMAHSWWDTNTLDRDRRVDRFFEPGEVIYTGLRVVEGKYLLVFSREKDKVLEQPESGSLFE
jgi:hypothetical protein